jgi:hypothetical protein
MTAVRDANQSLQTTVSQQRSELETAYEKVVRLERESAIIRSLGADLQVNFRGKWKKKPFPDQLLSPIDQEFYVYLLKSAKPEQIVKLHPAEYYALKEVSEEQATFHAKQTVRVGEFPLGSSVDALRTLDTFGIHIPFILYENLFEQKVTLDNIKLTFIVNGQPLETLSFEPHIEVPLRFYSNNRSIAWASHKWTAHVPIPKGQLTATLKGTKQSGQR